jgi:hypothetical protein
MSKKSKVAKKHRFKYAQPTTETASRAASAKPEAAVTGKPEVAASTPPTASAPTLGRDMSHVNRDVRRLSLLLGSLVVLELMLWWVLDSTVFGQAILDMVKL